MSEQDEIDIQLAKRFEDIGEFVFSLTAKKDCEITSAVFKCWKP